MREFHKWIIVVAFIGVAVLGGKLYSYHKSALEAARQSVITQYDQQDVQELERQLDASNDLLKVNKENSERYAQTLRDDNARLQSTIDSLRKRPSRTTTSQGVSNSTPCEATGTGAGLYREDAEFLIGEAARASAVVAERDYYYAAYRAAEDKLKELNGKD